MKKVKGIPKGPYCSGTNGMCCPYWSIRGNKPYQLNGYCKLMDIGDWTKEYYTELWNQVKCCEISEAYGDEE